MRDHTHRSFLRRLALPLMLSALILPCAVVLLRFAVARSQTADSVVSSVSRAGNERGTITFSGAGFGAKIAPAPVTRGNGTATADRDASLTKGRSGGAPSGKRDVSSSNSIEKLQDHSAEYRSAHSSHSAMAHVTMQTGTQPPVFTTHSDTIPNFAQNATIVSATNGNWSSVSTWDLGRVPTASDIVLVNHAVTYESSIGIADVIGIAAGGALRFRTDINTLLQVGVLLVQPNGILEVGTASQPVSSSVTAEIIIRNRSLNTTSDPDQYGTGLISIDGIVTMHGAVKTPTFVRTASEPRAANTTLTLEQPITGWRTGDRIFLPDTRQVHPDNWFNANYALQIEERTVQSISPDGRTITLSAALSFDHRGARDADGVSTVLSNGIKLLPHVGNLTRNVVIRSENPSGTRGHTLFTHRTNAEIAYVQFQDLGRTKAEELNRVTNHIGRYPLHAHHLWGPTNPTNTGYQFKFVGNAINDSLKWPMALHGSHYGLIKQNVVFGGSQLTGSGIAIEDGTETENLIEENFVANIRGNINARNSGPSTEDGSTPGSAAECYWSHGFNNRFINNVASDCRNPSQQVATGPGWKFIVQAAPYTARNPLVRGADMTNASQTIAVTPQYQPILEFRGNEVYGGSSVGFTSWELGTDGYQVPTGIQETLIKDFRVWNVYESAIWNYPSHRVTIDGLTSRADPSIFLYMPGAFVCGDYRNIDITVRGGSIHGGGVFGNCVDPLGTFRFENIDAVTYGHAFTFETPSTPGTGADRPASGVSMVLRNNIIRAWPGRSLQTIEMYHNTASGNNQPGDNYDVQVYDYQGQPGNNFRAYFGVQATQNIYGGLAPCNDTTTRPEVAGITCNTATPPPPDTTPPSTPTGLNATAVSSSQINLTWTASTDDVGVTEYRLERCQGAVCTSFTQIANPTATAFADTGLTSGTTYRYRVRTADAAVNLSGFSSIVNGTTSGSAPTVQFSAASYSIVEDCTSLNITVTRVGDTSAESTVRYATMSGTASDRADFTPAQGTLRFAPGESVKNFAVLITEDSRTEGTETGSITLSNPTGASLGASSLATLEILDDVSEPAGNAIDDPGNFVCQQYHDFLNRQPDTAGLTFWTNQITSCGNDSACVDLKRANASAAFFLSIEFQETGYLVHRMYRAAYGNLPGTPVPVRFEEFLPDTQEIGKGVVVGQTGWELALLNNKQAFATDFVTRSRFTTAHPTTLTPAQFVDALFTNAVVTPSATDRNAAINEFGGAGNTADTAARARALRRVAENSTLVQQETNRAFVLMQYFGYLRRNPNDAPEPGLNFDGYNFWLSKLNQFNGNFVNAEMVKAFIISSEYRQRFGP